jgi:predicted cupin superfamily sugar epimerase
MTPDVSADTVITALGLMPHPEGGHYAETWRDSEPASGRAYSSAIYYLLRAGEQSRWHRIDAAEIWHFYAGAALELTLSRDGHGVEPRRLGSALISGERPQVAVPAGWWQAARTLGDWSLVGCTVAPAFQFERFELADEHWHPTDVSRPVAQRPPDVSGDRAAERS